MVGGISYFNAELGTQSLLKINTKENPKAAKPIFIPFILFYFFLLGALLSSSCYLVAGFPPRAHSESECGGGVIPGPGHAAIDRKRGEEEDDPRTISLSEIYVKWDDGPPSETGGSSGVRTSSHCPVLLWGEGILESTSEKYLAPQQRTNPGLLWFQGASPHHFRKETRETNVCEDIEARTSDLSFCGD